MKQSKEQDGTSKQSLDAARAELLALLLGDGRDATGIPRRPSAAAHGPLSYGQEGLWFLAEIAASKRAASKRAASDGAASNGEGSGSAYNVPLAFRLVGALDVQALQVALSELIARHESLRTRFDLRDGRPTQIVDAAEPFVFDIVDAPADPDALQARLSEDAQQPFALAADHPFRAALYRCADDCWMLLLTLHHIVCDTRSIVVLLRDLVALYAAAIDGDDATLTPLPIQYADYAQWQRDPANAAAFDTQLEFWKQRLAGHVAADLPTDKPRPALPTFAGGQLFSTLPAPVVAALRDLARQEGSTLFMALMSLVQLLLSRWSGHRDIVIGTPIASRPHADTEELIGYFANTLLIRAEFDGIRTFRALLRHVKQSALDAYSNQDVPFERVVSALNVPRDLSRQPLFQVMVVLQDAGALPLPLPGVEATALAIDRSGAKFDLALEIFEHDDALAVRWEYATDLYAPATLERLSRQFQALAGEIARDPDRALDAVTLLGAAESRQLRQWNDTAYPIATDRLVHELFEAHAQRTPDAIAVSADGQTLTYAQLNTISNRFAHHLIARGIGPDSVVGLFFERSIELVVGIVGILKAGGAYLPIDPDFPDARVDYLLEDAKPMLVATSAGFAERLTRICGERRVCVIDAQRFVEEPGSDQHETGQRETDPVDRVHGHHLAYVMYTSGSTGRPKGVETSHAALLNRVLWMQAEYDIGADDRVLQKTPYTFDVSVWEFVWPLMTGARLVLARPGGHRDVHYLQETIRAEGITVLHFVPSMLAAFLAQSDVIDCPSLCHVICSGEALAPALVQRFFAAQPTARLHNLYGPTEAAIDVTYFECMRGVDYTSVPIGRPIWNTQMHVLDDALDPVPVGAVGGLYIGGAGLARGYRHRPDLTAERFIADPFSDLPGARLYHTGDLAKYRADGALEYLGRSDHQVKIRGVRIEVGEVEAALFALPDVRDCAVVVRERDSGKQLVACIVQGEDAGELERAALRSALMRTLPEAFMPDVFERWPALPVTSNGKLDRKALIEGTLLEGMLLEGKPPEGMPLDCAQIQNVQIDGASTEPAAVDATPGSDPELRGDIEARLLKIWREVLGRTDVDPQAGFFEVGGNSILAVTAARSVAETFGRSFYVTDLFRHSSVRELSGVLAAGTPGTQKAASVAPTTVASTTVASTTIASTTVAPTTLRAASTDRQPSMSALAGLDDSVAVIGLSCKFPGAEDVDQLWDNLIQGRESIEFLSPPQLVAAGISADLLGNPAYVAARSTIDGKAAFDAEFFKVTARDAQLMDPQLRHLLEHAWRAIEDAGYRASQIADTSVFMSASATFYHAPAFEHASSVLERSDEYVAWIWAQPGTIPTAISHKLGLKGPSMFVHSNCSSSLTALASAYRSIRAGEARQSLVGAATILPYAPLGYLHQEGMHFSRDGHLKAFDAAADGMISGEGVAVLLLKHTADAIADGDHIYALLRGIAANNDGADKAGFYAPSAKGQAEVIDRVLRTTGVEPDTIGYVEAHGTGTRLGDPIEFGALSEVYRRSTDRLQFCGLGSIKSNFGHLDTAAGLAGCLKVVLSLAHARIPPTLHYATPNPQLDLENSPFRIIDTLTEWPGGPTPRRAALSSFGIGGTNVHAIFEEWIAPAEAYADGICLIPLSARSEGQLRAYAEALARFLARDDAVPSLAGVAYTLQIGREQMSHRIAFAAATRGEAIDVLRRFAAGDTVIDLLYRSVANAQDAGEAPLWADDDFQRMVDAWIAKGKYRKLLDLWVRGYAVDWMRLYPQHRPRRVSLPTYPFARQDYWLSSSTPPSLTPPSSAPLSSMPLSSTPLSSTPAAVASLSPAVAPARAAEPADTVLVRECWIEAAAVRTQAPRRVLCIAGDEGSAQAYARALAAHGAEVEAIVDGDGLSDALADVALRGPVDAVVHASLASPADAETWRGVLRAVQGLFAAGLPCARLLLCAGYSDARSRCHAEALIGIERTLRVLVPQLQTAVFLQQDAADPACIWQELCTDTMRTVRYEDGRRHILRIRAHALPVQSETLQVGGVYWITGGAGGLGALVARHLLDRYQARVVVSGRRALDEAALIALRGDTTGGELLYVAADTTDIDAMRSATAEAVARFGAIDGVIHAAGVIEDSTLIDKSQDAFARVLAPKVQGTELLDAVLADQPLRFICYFSSTSAVLGDFGIGDYALANRFELAYADHVTARDGCRRIAIAWPLWADGGMQVGDDAATAFYLRSSGHQALPTAAGLALFERALAGDGHCMMIHGERARIERALGVLDGSIAIETLAPAIAAMDTDGDVTDGDVNAAVEASASLRRPELRGLSIEQCVQWELREQIGALLKLDRDRIQAHENLADYGFDSITLTQWARSISRHFGIELTPAIFFSHSTLDKVGRYLLAEYSERLQAFYREPDAAHQSLASPSASRHSVERPIALGPDAVTSNQSTSNQSASIQSASIQDEALWNEPLAVIGISGRFPQARTVDGFWQLLVDGRDVVEEIPLDRFDWREPYASGVITSKWLGALSGVDEFDPLFFDVSPREALGMDPRQRLLLQEAWNALEDAAYGEAQCASHRIGVFVGVEQGEYQSLAGAQGTLTSNHDAILASRLSYFMNLRGPAMAINTSCSSGLVAAHQACLSLRAGDCDTAIAAGVNLMLTPHAYWGMSQAGMLSEDGRCHVFDTRANGMVPGEAVVAVVLKRLSRAVADGDPIRAVIVGSGINYDGRTNGITAPSGAAQASLIGEVYARAGIDPARIGYIVTHGTATRLGDPVEINALDEVFRAHTAERGFCALTSTKSNFGHTFAASGLLNLVCAVESLRHRMIPASLHCEQQSDYIDWERSAFHVNRTTRAWPSDGPRLAAVSAFGMSGTNAHMLVQEYVAPIEAVAAGAPAHWLLALSAKSAVALQQRLRDLRDALQTREWDTAAVRALGYTLLCGRQHFAHRCVIVAQDHDDALHLLERAAAGERSAKVFGGVVPREFAGQKALLQTGQDLLGQLDGAGLGVEATRDALHALAELHCQGYTLPWERLYGEVKPRRIALPTYPFARDRYWVEAAAAAMSAHASMAVLHPLLHANTSDVDGQRYSTTLTGAEPVLADHVVNGERVLPGMAYLEIARAALIHGGGIAPAPGLTWALRHIVWARPLVVRDRPVALHIDLHRYDAEQIGYEIYSDEVEHGRRVHAQGSGVWMQDTAQQSIDIAALEARCDAHLAAEDCYARLRESGLHYGPAYRVLDKVGAGTDAAGARYVIARLRLPDAARHGGDMLLHPSLLDGALHAVVGLWREGPRDGKPLVPYGLERLEIRGAPGTTGVAVLREAAGSSDRLPMLNVQICDDEGRICVALEGFSARPVERDVGDTQRSAFYGRDWQHQPAIDAGADAAHAQRLVVLCPPDDADPAFYDQVLAALDSVAGVRCERLHAAADAIGERFADYGWQLIERLQQLLQDGHNDPVLIQLVTEPTAHGELLSALGALLRTARLENPRLRGQVVELPIADGVEAWRTRLQQDAACIDETIRYIDGVREVEGRIELESLAPALPWKSDGVYLVTGGLGGLGRIFTDEILRKAAGARIVLVGRSEPDDVQRAALRGWSDAGATVNYMRVDLSSAEAVAALVAEIDHRHGRLDGVLHSAGVTRDSFLLKKTHAEYMAVIDAKVRAALHLDAAIGERPLDFLVLFSSTTGVYGNVGQADYAAANAFLDAFAEMRQARVLRGERHGRSLAIAWPLWADGGMTIPAALQRQLREQGLVALAKDDGVSALYAALGSGRARVHLHRVDVALLHSAGTVAPVQSAVSPIVSPVVSPTVSPKLASNATAAADGEPTFDARVLAYLTRALSGTLKLPVELIEADAPFERYGLDSILALELTNTLERIFGSLSKTLFFEHQTLAALSRHFAQAHRERLSQMLDRPSALPAPPQSVQQSPSPSVPQSTVARAMAGPPRRRSQRELQPRPLSSVQAERAPAERADIAIVGVAGRYPGADTLDAFWDNLATGRDCITEIPAGRWDHARYFDPEKGVIGKTYGKWGGFVDGVDAFDPLFFNISPADARVMDPQERLFLQCAYETLEDAGYTRESLRRPSRCGRPGDVGVFVGVMYEEYQLYGAQAQVLGHRIALSGSPSSIANRVSYFCDFHGPSMAVDTMCSSSLTAIHLARESLLNGQCEAALAGGVNVTVHPNKYLMLGQGRFLASDGRCNSFGAGGDGYVPGEGVGAVLLKRLDHAIEDGDRVLAVIRGSVVNHGGKTNGYSVPNPVAQADLIAQALQDSGVPARTISYIEAHGTGTSLGDPIEITGLVKAFGAQTADTGFCAIGSVKSNIGHCESAAGVAALTKVLLQMKHGKLVPSLHADPPNPYIDFAGSPFVVQRALGEWRQPVDAAGQTLPRRAGISSFGAGGSNAHLIIEEYEAPTPSGAHSGAQMIVLSAKTEDALQRLAGRLHAFVTSAGDTVDLADLAHTLQVGREAMEHRLAFVAESTDALRETLRACADGDPDIAGCHRGEPKRSKDMVTAFAVDDDLQAAVQSWLARGKYDTLLEFWVKGLNVDWGRLHATAARPPRRISLPTYPFARERYWIGAYEIGLDGAAPATEAMQPAERLLCKQWEAAPLALDGKALDIASQQVAILATPSTQGLAAALSAQWPNARVVVDAATALGDCDVLIDIAGCGDDDGGIDWIAVVQAWLQSRSAQGGRALCVTRGLASEPPRRSGALRAGLYRMLQSEYGRIGSCHVDVEHCDDGQWIAQCVDELGASGEIEVRYRGGVRERARLVEVALGAASALAWPDEGVLWVTGGTRGIGLACARHFVSRHGVSRLVLSGREVLPAASEWAAHAQRSDGIGEKVHTLLALQAQGVQLHVSSVDLTDASAVAAEIEAVRQTLGPIAGVLHCAGLADGATPALIRKSRATIEAVLAPKVAGVDVLLRAVAGESLRFCALFSSISGTVPELASGQADYAMANAYMDNAAQAYAASGVPVVSVQWGSWNESGMGEVRSRVYRELGLLSHSDAQGLSLLDRILAAGLRGAVAPLRVDAGRFDASGLLRRRQPVARAAVSASVSAVGATVPVVGSEGGLLAAVQQWLRELFAQQLQLDRDRLELDTPLPDYGVDSVLLMQVLVPINALVGESLDPSMLYEHQTITAFSKWLVGKYGAALSASLAAVEAAAAPAMLESSAAPAVRVPVASAAVVAPAQPVAVSPTGAMESLAVVGLACRFAGANDLQGYWELLAQGRSAIAPVPLSRWGEASDDWAALLDNVDRFDPQFFQLALADARAMDRQALMVLEESLNALHHAGYRTAEVKGSRMGVYLGARGQYHADAESLRDAQNPILATGQNYLAANVSHFFDLRGPSLVVDTACSSALVALNMAAQALRCGEITSALVGGVSLLSGPGALRMFERRGILQRGEYHIFDRRAQGAILGEGIGMVVVKTRAQAEADGDRIYALIGAVAVNNDGRTAGPTAPNVHAQKDVMQQALARSGRRAEDVSHIDVNGSGSEVTDLLELRAIETVYRSGRAETCELGSMKPNIGHPLCAEGIASLIKVVLMLHHDQRVPFLSAREPMQHYDFEASPFRFTRELRGWGDAPRVAAINSFADGGTNAHVILEAAPVDAVSRREPLPPPVLNRIALSSLAPAARRPAQTQALEPEVKPVQPVTIDDRLAVVELESGFWERYG